jgi:2-oxoisovalerate dehydrogenase E1 component alpha subunit
VETTVRVFERERTEGHALPVALPDEELQRLYALMVLVRTADQQAVRLQRQGRISFYVGCEGEEAAEVGSAYALRPEDWAFTDYRASGVVLTRGLPLTRFYAHLMGNREDLLKGRAMPSHWGSRALNIVAPASPICTQLPQAVGTAVAAQLRGERLVTIAYFGDGGTSSNDFHTGLNLAGVFRAPTVFFCRNNRYAISVPVARQTASQSLAVKATAYGLEGVQVDGNDALAVYAATHRALAKARDGGGATLIEALTYRLGPHSTSDDPRRYRAEPEEQAWRAQDPLLRLRQELERRGLWDAPQDTAIHARTLEEVKNAITTVEQAPLPALTSLVEDVYAEPPWHLAEELAAVGRASLATSAPAHPAATS